MKLEQLQHFHAIVEYGSFFKAALERNITQSALSKQISKLEQELGVLLFDRSHREITLTNAGKQFLKDTESILSAYSIMLSNIAEIKQEENCTLRIAISPTFYQYHHEDIFNQFIKQYPNVHLSIDEIEEFDLQNKALSKAYDMYILRGDYDLLHTFEKITLFQDTLVAVLSKKHLLSQKNELSIQQLAKEGILLTPKHTMIAQIAIDSCLKAGFTPHILRHGRMESILPSVSANQGIAIVMNNTLPFFKLDDVVIKPFKENIHADINLYYVKDSHKDIINDFITFLQQR